jgi:hypothetical protein
MFIRRRRVNKPALIMAVPSVFLLLVSIFGFSAPAKATFTANTQISNGQAFLQGEFAEVGVRANGAFGSTSVPSGFHANPPNCLGFRVDREMDGWGATTDDGDYFCPGSPFEGWQMKVAESIGKNDHGQTGIAGGVSDIQDSGSSQCVSWISASPFNGVSVSQRYCVPTAGQALHTDVTLTNTTGSAISDVYFGRGFDPDNATGSGSMTCAGGTVSTSMFQSCNGVTGQGTEAQATARWGNNAFIALQSFDARARVARQTGGFSSPDPADIWNAGNILATSGTYLGNVGEMYADAGIYVALNVPTLGAGASTSFRISYVLSADGNNAPVLGSPVVSGIGQTSATVASTVNPKGFSTTAQLVYSTDPDFGTSSSVSMGTLTGTDEVAIDAEITGLDPSEIYYAKIVATNETGETESAVFEFETLAATAPIVSSEEPTVTVDDGPVTLSGTLNPNGFSSTAVFQYSTTADFSGTVVDIPVSGTFTGTSLSTVSTVVEGLTGSTTYYFRLKVTNLSGISAYGSTLSFVPADIPAPTAAYLNPVTNLTAVANADGSVDLDWDASAASNTAIYGYSVSFYDLTVIGGATSGGWGVWTNQGTNYSLSTGMFSGSNPVTTGYGPVRFGIKAGNQSCFSNAGVGPCVYGPEVTVDATVVDPTPVTTTTTTSTTTTTTTTTSTTVAPVVVTPPDGTTVPLPQYPEPETESTTVPLPVETEPEIELPTETIPEYSEPIGIDPTETETVVIIIPPDDYTVVDIEENEPITTVILDNILEDTFTTDIEVDEVGAVLDTLLGAELTDTQFDNVLEAVFTEDVSADVFTEALTTMLDADITSEQLTAVLDSAFSENTSAENMVSALVSIFDGPLSSGDLDTVMAAVFDEDISVADTMTVLGDLLETNLSASETEAIFDSVFDDDLSDAETIDLIVDVLADELTSELLNTVLGAVFDEEVSNEVLIETFTAVLGNELDAESVGVIVDVLESDTISSEQVGQVVTLVIEQEGGIESGQATELATSAKVLESIDGEQASAVFNAIVVSEVSEEAGAEISEALTEAPTDVKESFEEEINVFAGVFDTYTALGSSIDVGTRRSVIAVNLVTSTVALATAAGGIPTPGPSTPSAPRQDIAARKEEEETEEGGAIEGEGPDWIKQISIYKYEDGVRVMDWKNFARKFVYGVMASGFTLAGATVMYFTLSGLTQQVALWGTVLAFTASMYLHMKEPDDE